jgi:hypothetical protein
VFQSPLFGSCKEFTASSSSRSVCHSTSFYLLILLLLSRFSVRDSYTFLRIVLPHLRGSFPPMDHVPHPYNTTAFIIL